MVACPVADDAWMGGRQTQRSPQSLSEICLKTVRIAPFTALFLKQLGQCNFTSVYVFLLT